MLERKSFFLKRRGYTEHCLQQEMLINIRRSKLPESTPRARVCLEILMDSHLNRNLPPIQRVWGTYDRMEGRSKCVC